jgi:hypothetical protein
MYKAAIQFVERHHRVTSYALNEENLISNRFFFKLNKQ